MRGIGPKVGFIHEEDLGSTLLGLLSDLAVLEDEGFPFFILGFQEAFLGSLQHEAQPMEEQQGLETLVRRYSTPQQLARRASAESFCLPRPIHPFP